MQKQRPSLNATRSRHAKSLRKEMSAPRVVAHRASSKAAKVHLYVRENRERPRSEVVAELQKKFKLTESTARNWFQNFKTSLPDLRPRAM
jgi:predicted solute-binding protein